MAIWGDLEIMVLSRVMESPHVFETFPLQSALPHEHQSALGSPEGARRYLRSRGASIGERESRKEWLQRVSTEITESFVLESLIRKARMLLNVNYPLAATAPHLATTLRDLAKKLEEIPKENKE